MAAADENPTGGSLLATLDLAEDHVTDILLRPLDAALDGTGQLIAGVTGERWQLPTPCTDWTVRQLVNHLVGGNRLATRVLRGEPLPPVDQLGRRGAEDQLGDDPGSAYRTSADELLEAMRAPGVLDRAHTLPAGTLPGPAVVHLRIVETLVHGWDLARATGRQVPFPDRLAEEELTFSRDLLGRLPEGRRPFAPSRPIPDDAPAIDRLAALLGRPPEPAWSGRSA
ncbi:MAG: TIGR03086 family protein [Geodermatophilales bacterium]|nr:TIGR03086 family protein [Geodermatophilales bacterium]